MLEHVSAHGTGQLGVAKTLREDSCQSRHGEKIERFRPGAAAGALKLCRQGSSLKFDFDG